MKIAIGCDHGGYFIQKEICDILNDFGHEIINYGTFSEESVDYPDFATKVCLSIQKNISDRGILICKSGIGMSISANKFIGIYAGLANSINDVISGRSHNNINVLCLAAKTTLLDDLKAILQAFVSTPFEEGRHMTRFLKIKSIESKYLLY